MGFCGHIDTVKCANCSPVRHSGGVVPVDAVGPKPYADLVLKAPPRGVWVAYNADDSGITPFATEIDALRYAVNLGMAVKFVEYGSNI